MENASSPRNSIFLTFDDGPNEPYTSQILDILKHYRACASFFVCGKNALFYPEVTRRIVAEGHSLGNHSYSHSRLLTYAGLLRREIETTDEILQKITGVETRLFRPPWGIAMPWLGSYIKASGHKMILWDIMAFDWWKVPVSFIINRVSSHARPNAIVLLHDGNQTRKNSNRNRTVLALPGIIEKLKEKDFDFETL